MNLSSLTRRRPRIFFGWWTVALAGFIHSINSSAFNKGFVVFLLPVSQGLNVSLAQVTVVFSLSRSEGGPIGPIAGWLIDRFGTKPILFIGTVMSGAGFLLLARTDDIWTFGLVYLALITVGSDLAFSNSLSALINHWFHRRRALAMSSYHSISSLAPSLLVFPLALLIASEGWRTASMVAGLTILGIALPVCFLIRSTPESLGMLPDGDAVGPSFSVLSNTSEKRRLSSNVPPNDYGIGEAFHTVSYWLLLAGSVLRLTAKAGVMLPFISIMVWKGIDARTGAGIFSILLFLGVPLSLVFGWLADKFPKNLVLFASAISGTTAFFLLAAPLNSIWVIFLFVVLFAIAETAGSNNWATFGDYFGRKAYGRLRGFTQLASSPGVFLAPLFSTWWFGQTGSYALPLWVFTVIFALSAISFALMRRPVYLEPSGDAAASPTI